MSEMLVEEISVIRRERDALALQLTHEWGWPPTRPMAVLHRLRSPQADMTFCEAVIKFYKGEDDESS